jgi:hypothetical protein
MTGLRLNLGAARRTKGVHKNFSQRCKGAGPHPLMKHLNRGLNIVATVAAPNPGMVAAGVVVGNTTIEYSATFIKVKNVA